MKLHPTTPEIWYKIQRRRAETAERVTEIETTYDKWRKIELHVKLPFEIELTNSQTMERNVYFTGFKTDGTELFVEYQIIQKGPKLVQKITG